MMKLLVMFLSVVLWAAPCWAAVADEKSAEFDIDRKLAHAEELFEQGHTAESKQICESLLRTLPDRPSPQRGYALNVISKIEAADGEYERAIDSARRSADAYHKVRDVSGEAHALNNKGIAELQTGSYSEAQQDLSKALTLSETVNDLENQVQVLNNMGSAHYFRGSYSEGMRAYEQAMTLVNANAAAKWSEYWLQITKFNQATLLQRLGRYDGALRIYRDVEASSKTLTGGDRAHLDANLGTLYRRLGDPYKALDAYRAAQNLYSQQHDADGEIAVLKNTGIVYALDLDDLPHAARVFGSALTLAQKMHNRREEMQSHLYLGETLFRTHDLAIALSEFERAQELAGELATSEEQWKALYGLARIEAARGDNEKAESEYRSAIALIEQSRSRLQLSGLRAEFFADKRDVYDGLILILLQKNQLGEAFLFLEKSRARNFQDRVQVNQSSGAGALSLEEVQVKLSPGTALLEFWVSGNQLGLIWCTHATVGVELKQFTLEEQSRIDEWIGKYPDSLQNLDDEKEKSPLDATFGKDWPPLPNIRHLLIVPDGWLSGVPFDLLRAGGGSSAPLIERYDITYLPTAALLRRSSEDRHIYGPWTRELVAFGDPIVPSEEIESKGPGVHIQDAVQADIHNLPYSAQEIDDVAHLVRGTSQLFLQSNDQKTTFLNGSANSALLLHVSTHAFADADRPEDSRLLFSPEGAGSAPNYVFLRELYDLDLTHVNLATISACDTERGKVMRGEGVQAFSRALLAAGANSSVTALWRVDDRSTAEFMKQFHYFLLQKNESKAEALRLAKLKFIHSESRFNHPAVWAAFVLNGEGLTPVPRVLSWKDSVLGAAALLAALLLIFFLAARLWSRSGRDGEQRA
jgi:CHAT domain-containing protein/Flp pilus assembly protein TadD